MKRINVQYFHETKLEGLKFTNGQQFDYSIRKRNYIIQKVLDSGYNVMLQQHTTTDVLIIWIDKYRFQQR